MSRAVIKARCQFPSSYIIIFFLLSYFEYARGNDVDLLLSLKASIDDPLHYLSDWNSFSSVCSWHGISCDNSSSRVTSIHLPSRNISGQLSPSIFQLSNLESLDLSDNQLSGKLPINIFSCLSLRFLNTSNNNLTGAIPSIGYSSRLETLDMSNNMLSGDIPEDIGMFSKLEHVDIGGNVLTGEIPVSISNISSLKSLTLASNQLVGPIPSQLGLMRRLRWVYLGYNNLSGEIPAEIGSLTFLNHLDLVYNNLTGDIPSSFRNLTNLNYLFLYQNKLTGSILPVSGLKNLIALDLSDNYFSGEIPEEVIQLQSLEILHLFSNNFTGRIPNALASLPRLHVLQLWSNNFSGEIPETLGKRSNLTVLDLSSNELLGKIPETLCHSGGLSKLILFSNSLHGGIPESLGRCRSLRRVRLQENRLSGELSPEFKTLPLVYFLDVSGNDLSGRVDGSKWEMPSLQMLGLARNRFFGTLPESFGGESLENLDLSENDFTGTIPVSFGALSGLTQLKLSHNNLSGDIPEELASCTKLVSLDLSHNELTGNIPLRFSDMPVLGQLDLSQNRLSGTIPSNLGHVESLVQVNVSHNRLQGTLPSNGAFLAINASSVAGNAFCGGDAASGLPSCGSRGGSGSLAWWLVVSCLVAALFALGLALLFVAMLVRKRKRWVVGRVENENGSWEIQLCENSITIDDMLSVTSDQEIKREGFLHRIDGSMQVVVKEMNDVDLITEVSGFGKVIRHRNIVKLIGTVRSEKCGYLVYEHIDGESLMISEVVGKLGWTGRQRIAVGIARAMRFLHHTCSPQVVVGDLSPEIITVDGKGHPRLRLGVSCVDANAKGFIPLAYHAPETRETKSMTHKSDIYGFGLILIQLMTGKAPTDVEFGVHASIVEWAQYCYSDCHFDKWVDPIIRANAMNNKNEIVKTMNLALRCIASDPLTRPCSGEVFETLESIGRNSPCVSIMKFSSHV